MANDLTRIPLSQVVARQLDDQTIARAMFRAATVVQAEAVQNAPKLEGHLRESARVVQPKPREATVVFDIAYATRQHEELGYEHEYGGAKFLENAVREKASEAAQVVATAIRKALK